LVIDEAARVADNLYLATRPMLGVSNGRLVCLSTPWGRRGFFFELWGNGDPNWERVKITAGQCPRLSKEFLEEERRNMPAAWFDAEYLCEFTATVDAVFSQQDIDRAFSSTVQPLFGKEL
jgi:hypothetical protein